MKLAHRLALLLLLCLWAGHVGPAGAHGGGKLQVNQAPVGSCRVSVWSAPSAPRANTPLHVTVGVAQAVDGAPVLDALVQVQVVDTAGNQPVAQATATTGQSANKLFYEADLPALRPGPYTFAVTTSCGEATATVSFPVEIRPAVNPLFIALPLVAGALLAAAGLYHKWQKQGQTAVPLSRKGRPAR